MPPKFSHQITIARVNSEMDKLQHRISPCENACPAKNPIQKLHTLVSEGRQSEAGSYLLAKNPLSAITSKVCPHPCESVCNRKDLDEHIAIQKIEGFVSGNLNREAFVNLKKAADTKKRIAIVGSGPAGLSCAYFLALFGHHPTVLESETTLGGIPGLAIPENKLSGDINQRAVDNLLGVGILAKTNTRLGRDISLEDLQNQYDAIVIAVGAWQERKLNVTGESACVPALAFLREAKSGTMENIGKNVLVIGGGGVAFDCALVAKQGGATDVKIVCLENDECLCAHPEDVLAAKAAGIDILGSRHIDSIVVKNGIIKGVDTRKINAFQFDETGCVLIDAEGQPQETINADIIIVAIGQMPAIASLQGKKFLKTNPNGTLFLDETTGMTSVEGIFAAGDAVLGPSSVAAAIGSGRETALRVDRFLMARDADKHFYIDVHSASVGLVKGKQNALSPHIVAFDEIFNTEYYLESAPEADMTNLKASDAMAREATRCMHCGQCRTCWMCVEDCPGLILKHGEAGPIVAYPDECWHCGCCRIACPTAAISYQFPLRMLL